jgi:hypothetical protein
VDEVQRLADGGDAAGGPLWVPDDQVVRDVSDGLNGKRGRQLSLELTPLLAGLNP